MQRRHSRAAAPGNQRLSPFISIRAATSTLKNALARVSTLICDTSGKTVLDCRLIVGV